MKSEFEQITTSSNTVRLLALMLVSALAVSVASAQDENGERDGEVRPSGDDKFLAWDAQQLQWLEPEAFWQSFAERKRGRIWPAGSEFPPYAEVDEHDTFLLQLEQGPCLMYFFHQRWRRANDVWRWGPEFNEYGGCPHVFDRR